MPGAIPAECAALIAAQEVITRAFSVAFSAIHERRDLTVLDIGSADGRTAVERTMLLHERFGVRELVGIDTDDSMDRGIARANHRIKKSPQAFGATFLQMDARSADDIPDESVDVVTIERVLQHLPDEDIVAVLKAARRVLKPQGHIFTGGDPLWLKTAITPDHLFTAEFLAGISRLIPNHALDERRMQALFAEAGLGHLWTSGCDWTTDSWEVASQMLRVEYVRAELASRQMPLHEDGLAAWIAEMARTERGKKEEPFSMRLIFTMTVGMRLE